jgi:serine/threonine protein kinase
MSPNPLLWLRAKEIVGDALELPPESRAEFIEARCEGDSALLAEVAAFLRTAGDTADFLKPSQTAFFSAANEALDLSGSLFGAYRLQHEIGRGGMSIVYLASRADGAYEQKVAVKLMLAAKLGESSKRVARERQALASLDHPNIARLVDGGESTSGIPYLVMDYVDGVRIDEWCNREMLDTNARVALVVSVCRAVQHAHQNLIIHRDIKPANILVAKNGTAKLLDFGVARLLETAGEATDITQAGQLLFTPRFASPEQVMGQTISVSTDVYGLGMLLYELLAGTSPFVHISSESATNAAAAMRAVLEDEFRQPSQVAKQFAPARAAEIRGDMDLILTKACARNVNERYQTVAELMADLESWLKNEPVTAKPATWGYLSQKFILRNKLVTAISAALFVSLISGVVLFAWKSSQESRERALAEKRFDDVRKLAHKSLFEYYDVAEQLPNSLPLRELLVNDGINYLDSLRRDAGDNLDLLQEIATGYERLGSLNGRTWAANRGRPEIARENFDKAIITRERIYAMDSRNFANATALASTLQEMADLEIGHGTTDKAITLATRGIAVLAPHIESLGVSASIPASITYSKLLRMRASLDSCAGSNTRGYSREAFELLKTNAPFFTSLMKARSATSVAGNAKEAAHLAQGDYIAFMLEYGVSASCRGEFAIARDTLSEALNLNLRLLQESADKNSFTVNAAMTEIELATNEWQYGDYTTAAKLARQAYERMQPLANSAPGDAGLQLRWLVMMTKTANFLASSPDEQDINDAWRLLQDADKFAQAAIKKSASNQFANVMATSIRNKINALTATRGNTKEAISNQLMLITNWEKNLNASNIQAIGLQARLYNELARMHPPTERVAACRALDQSMRLNARLLERDRELLRMGMLLLQDAALAREWSTTETGCADPRYYPLAQEILKNMKSRNIKQLSLPAIELALTKA